MEANRNALVRRLQRYSGAAQETIGPRFGLGQLGQHAPGMQQSPRDYLQEEQDRARVYLAAELLKIRAEAGGYELAEEAPKCLAAAEVIYPELPEDSTPE